MVENESLEEIRMHSRAVNQGKGVWVNAVSRKFNNRGVGRGFLGACLDETVPFRSPIQVAIFLPFQNRENALFIVETVAERNCPIFAKQALKFTMLLKAMERILLLHGYPCLLSLSANPVSTDGQKVAMDSIGGAGGFMALATVDVYVAISSACIYP